MASTLFVPGVLRQRICIIRRPDQHHHSRSPSPALLSPSCLLSDPFPPICRPANSRPSLPQTDGRPSPPHGGHSSHPALPHPTTHPWTSSRPRHPQATPSPISSPTTRITLRSSARAHATLRSSLFYRPPLSSAFPLLSRRQYQADLSPPPSVSASAASRIADRGEWRCASLLVCCLCLISSVPQTFHTSSFPRLISKCTQLWPYNTSLTVARRCPRYPPHRRHRSGPHLQRPRRRLPRIPPHHRRRAPHGL